MTEYGVLTSIMVFIEILGTKNKQRGSLLHNLYNNAGF